MIRSISISSRSHEELIDITGEVMNAVRESGVPEGICVIYTPHTTAGITINENADPDVRRDIIRGLAHFQFEKVDFAHMEGNSPAHLKSSLVGCSETVMINEGKLVLGTWQGIYFCEFDGPRQRKVLVKIIRDR